MKKNLIFFIIFTGTIFAQSASPFESKFDLESLQQDFIRILEKPLRYSKVDSIVIIKPYADFILKSGILFECPLINNDVHALLFVGDGSFRFSPPNEIEEMQLFRFYSKKNLDENFESLFLLFNDSTYNQIKDNLIFAEGGDYNSYRSGIKEAFEYIFDDDEGFKYNDIAYIFLEGKDSKLFYSHFNDNEDEPMFYEINPMYEEEFRLMRKYNRRFTTLHEVICQFSSEPDKTFAERNKKLINGEINISQYTMEIKIEKNLDLSAKVNLSFSPKFENQEWIIFNLYPDLQIDSLLLNGRKINYYQNEESYNVFVECDEMLKTSDSYAIDFYYQGELFEKNELGWVSIKSPNYWFPRCSSWDNSLFDLTFFVPEKYKFCSVGSEILKEEVEEDLIKYRFLTKTPIKNVSFSFGLYNEYKIEESELPPVTVLISEYGHNKIGHELALSGILSKGDMEEKIAADVVNSISLFSHVYGKIPLENIFVTETPYFHGEAFQGLVHLSWIAFQGIQDKGMVEKFIAHEVAHQWWGIQVDVDSYHDKWLGEAIAEYSGLWYMQLALKDNDRFFEILDEWKEKIIYNRKYLFGSGQEAGPIWLGYRTHSNETEGDYQLIIYKKGAWVLHMLRNMLLDLQTMKEDKFENMMRDFFSSYSGKKASTKDFQKIVEKHFGMKMDWFFNQWMYNTAIPDYQFSYKITETQDGKFKVRCKVLQSNVTPEFKMFVNLLVKFREDKFVRLRVEITGNKPEFDLPLLPLKPVEIIFNDLNSILCNVNYESWD